MQVEVLYRPSFSMARVIMEPNEAINAESGAMVGMSANMQIETHMRGGLFQSLARSVLGGESFFMNTFHAGPQGGELLLAPSLPGDIVTQGLQGQPLLVQSGSYMASSPSITVDTKWGGARTFFASEGLVMLRCSGTGGVILSSYGAIHEINLAAGQSFVVDTGHLVAFNEALQFKVRPVGGLKSSILGKEGLVVELTGPGKVLIQTRSEQSFLAWLMPKLPKQSGNS